MDDVKISELPVATAIASPDVAPIVQGGVTKQAAVSLFGGGFPCFNVARVDQISGDDSTGVVGDLSKPFATIAAALLPPTAHIVYLSDEFNGSEDLVILGGSPTFIGESPEKTIAFHSLTCDGSNPLIAAHNCILGDIIYTGDGNVQVNLYASVIGNITTLTGGIAVICVGDLGTNQATFSALASISITGFTSQNNNITAISSMGDVDGNFALLGDVTCDTLRLRDARTAGTVTANSVIITDFLLNPALTDFSTLPTTEPTEIGKAWIDTTGGNIVKVHL